MGGLPVIPWYANFSVTNPWSPPEPASLSAEDRASILVVAVAGEGNQILLRAASERERGEWVQKLLGAAEQAGRADPTTGLAVTPIAPGFRAEAAVLNAGANELRFRLREYMHASKVR